MSEWHGDSSVFRTYFRGSGKRPAEKVKGQAGRSFEDASTYESFGGVLNEEFVDISVDSKDMYECLLDMAESNEWRCLALPSPHGGHFYFRNTKRRISKSGKDIRLAVGVTADIHKGSTYIPLRVDGEDRFPPDYSLLEGDVYQEVPEELCIVSTQINLWRMSEHEGRNEDLFRYILILQSQVSRDKAIMQRIIKNANEFVFKDPIDQKELDVILRDEAFNKPTFWDGSKYQYADAARYLVEVHHAVIIDRNLHIFRDGIYVPDMRSIERTMISVVGDITRSQRKETYDYMNLIAQDMRVSAEHVIAFNNGILNLDSEEMLGFTDELVLTNKIPWDYDPEAYSELADHTLNKISCGDQQIRDLLEEVIGYCMYRGNEFQKFFILTGEKANGKSTFLDALGALLGEQNTAALDLNSLSDRFSTVMLHNKLANLGDDIADDYMSGGQVATLKKIVTGETIKAERKGQDAFDFKPYAKLVFSANDIPRMRDRSGAVMRRMVIVPFNATFSKNDADYDPRIRYKMKQEEVIQYLIRIGIEGLQRVFDNQGFTECDSVRSAMDEYHSTNDTVYAFSQEVSDDEIIHETVKDVFTRYNVYCSENGLNAVGRPAFVKQFEEYTGFEVVKRKLDGKTVQVYEDSNKD